MGSSQEAPPAFFSSQFPNPSSVKQEDRSAEKDGVYIEAAIKKTTTTKKHSQIRITYISLHDSTGAGWMIHGSFNYIESKLRQGWGSF